MTFEEYQRLLAVETGKIIEVTVMADSWAVIERVRLSGVALDKAVIGTLLDPEEDRARDVPARAESVKDGEALGASKYPAHVRSRTAHKATRRILDLLEEADGDGDLGSEDPQRLTQCVHDQLLPSSA